MTPADNADDHKLVRAVLAGDAVAAERFLRAIADAVWSSCRRLTRDEGEARAAFTAVLAALRADGFRRLAAYDGRSRLATFIELFARDQLAQRLLELLREDAARGWRAFEGFFQADMRRIIQRRLPGVGNDDVRRDAYQEICVALIADDYRRLKAYAGAGSFTGFVLHTIDRVLVDFIRTFSKRRRMPAAVARLPALEQEIFRQVFWQGAAADAGKLAVDLARRVDPPPSAADIAAALERVKKALPKDHDSSTSALLEGGSQSVPAIASPEETAIAGESQNLLSIAAGALREVTATLPEAERLYLQIALGGAEPLPAREVARLMGRPVEEVYKLKQRTLKALKDALEDHEAVKKWRASV
jgi:RNA polymerase primary sigma factor